MDGAREELALEIPGAVAYLDEIRAFTTRHARAAGFSQGDVDDIVLSLDEAVANVIEHAYEDSPLPPERRTLALAISVDGAWFRIALRDRGAPFDPTRAPEVDLDAHLARYRTGGLGIHFMRKLMDELTWRYEDGNVLELAKRLR